MMPAARPTWASTSSIIPRAFKPTPRARSGAPRNPATVPPKMPPRSFPMKATAVIATISGHAVSVIDSFTPTKAKKMGAKSPNVTEDTALRIRSNWTWPSSRGVMRIPP